MEETNKQEAENNNFINRIVLAAVAFIKNPLNLCFIVILILGIAVRWKYFFIESLWTDEAHYTLYGSRLTNNPLYIFDPIFGGGVYLPQIMIGIFNIFTEPFIAGRLMALTYSILGIIFAFLLGKEVKDRYVGLAFVLLYAFNHEIWFNSSRTLTDSPITTMFIISVYALVKYEKDHKLRHLIYFIIAVLATILTKPQGYILLPIIGFYYMIKFSLIKEERQKINLKMLIKNKYLVIGIMAVFLGIIFLRGNWIYNILKTNLTFYLDFVRLLPYMAGWPVIIFLIIGIVIALTYQKKEYLAVLSWFMIGYLVFIIHQSFVLPRYILPMFPPVLLLAAIALYESHVYLKILTNIQVPRILMLLLVLVVVMPYYKQGEAISSQKVYSYTGYDEAGTWLKDNENNGYSQVFVGSTSPSTLYSGIRYHTEGGSLRSTSQFKDIDELMRYINHNSTAKDFYVQLSIWEYGDYWAFPITQELINKIISKRFEIVKIVEREIATEKGLQKAPVFLIFKYTKVTENVKTETLNASTIS
ncbi:glycosyltransferase family 39 protein [Candidatus Woesearchaeota archaeon]|nr:glycosyltransferase family 39 protein [Candidatus Woesearchaeota archaeon]